MTRARRASPSYDPFVYDPYIVRRLEVSWITIESDDLPFALRALAQFRRANPDHGSLLAEQLTWGYAWTENPTLLDMSRGAKDRADLRCQAVRIAVVFCAHDGETGYSADLPWPSVAMLRAFEEEEVARRSEVDWMHHEFPEG